MKMFEDGKKRPEDRESVPSDVKRETVKDQRKPTSIPSQKRENKEGNKKTFFG